MKYYYWLLLLRYEFYPLCSHMKKQASKIFKNLWIAMSPATRFPRDDVQVNTKCFWKFLLTLFFFLLPPITSNAASLEISKVNNAKLIRQFEELAFLKDKSAQEIQPTLSKAAQNLLTYLAPKIKHLDGFNTTFVINCTVPFDSNDINNIKCDVDFSAIDPGNQTDPNALILRENIRKLRHNNIFLTRSFLNCSSGEYLSGTNGIYFEQPWDWTMTESLSNIEKSKTSLPTVSDTESYSETKSKTASISNTYDHSESSVLNTRSSTISDTGSHSETRTLSISHTQTTQTPSKSITQFEIKPIKPNWLASTGVYKDATNQEGRYEINNGVVTDTFSNLRWQQTVGAVNSRDEALKYCANLTVGNFTDWRLPAFWEIQSLIDYTIGPTQAVINSTAFPSTPAAYFWVSDLVVGNAPNNSWWVINVERGEVFLASSGSYAKCVRPAESLPDNRYVDQNGELLTPASNQVKDVVTGLIWQRSTSPTTNTQSNDDARNYCAQLVVDNESAGSWRLPTIKELSTLMNLTIPVSGPTINQVAFPNTPSNWYWSSTKQLPTSSGNTWQTVLGSNVYTSGVASISGNNGDAHYLVYTLRCVRCEGTISSCQELQNIQQNLNGNYVLINNINCSDTKNWNDGAGFVPIGFNNFFNGTLNGNNYTISNLYVNYTNAGIQGVGLFSSAGNKAIIKNIKLVNVSINSISGVHVGTAALVGTNNGAQIVNIHITRNITAYGKGGYVGGLVGSNNWGNITNSSFAGTIDINRGTIFTGGLVGYNGYNPNTKQPAAVISSYADINIVGANGYVAGLIAMNNGIIINSYATGIINADNNANKNSIGGLIGEHGGGNISNSNAFVTVIGGNNSDYVGGLIGSAIYSFGNIQNSYATGNVSGGWWVGGLIGAIGSAFVIQNSYATGNVNGGGDVGGLVGQAWGVIKNSYATGNVGGNGSIGGLVGGTIKAVIQSSYATGNVRGRGVGGLVGEVNSGIIQNSYATGNLNGNEYVGGLIGIKTSCDIKNSYSIGTVKGNANTGGLIGVGDDSSNITHSYWNTETSGQNTSAGGQGETTEEMMQKSTYVGWDFDNVWEIKEGESYPTLRWQKTKN